MVNISSLIQFPKSNKIRLESVVFPRPPRIGERVTLSLNVLNVGFETVRVGVEARANITFQKFDFSIVEIMPNAGAGFLAEFIMPDYEVRIEAKAFEVEFGGKRVIAETNPLSIIIVPKEGIRRPTIDPLLSRKQAIVNAIENNISVIRKARDESPFTIRSFWDQYAIKAEELARNAIGKIRNANTSDEINDLVRGYQDGIQQISNELSNQVSDKPLGFLQPPSLPDLTAGFRNFGQFILIILILIAAIVIIPRFKK